MSTYTVHNIRQPYSSAEAAKIKFLFFEEFPELRDKIYGLRRWPRSLARHFRDEMVSGTDSIQSFKLRNAGFKHEWTRQEKLFQMHGLILYMITEAPNFDYTLKIKFQNYICQHLNQTYTYYYSKYRRRASRKKRSRI